ncbi:tetratricopeptide (TPR) repeat protein [Allocatelliglobosispora scoriae]|uniref:Tetratricopeptide (TPR) repeat protein n=1 Tax=Allocatelliglobosispora scoriae TaxID=643052 RepID=A0A841BJJ3_9ACTN|nr:tetratricopeptide repeat protein [Allocatelliglobosispora scoriae]MBB5866952.1 tetratricopeptide (TPR) repeat protein [Allocatelliglobosispora scoriae]
MDDLSALAAAARTADALAALLRDLRRRQAREQGRSELTYREIAHKTGWSLSAVGEYFTGTTVAPTDRFDVLIQLLGATTAQQRALATARDRVDEARRRPAEPARGVPRQLPADVSGFTGRSDALTALDELIADTGTVVISAVSGTAGVGKTALAVHWAHRVAGRYRDGQLYADLHGYAPHAPVDPHDTLAGFLRALGVEPADVPPGADERAAAYRTILSGRRVLVVLDNARTADQVRPLLPGAAGCAVVVTSRDELTGLVARDGARPVALDVLSPAEALDLLRNLLGARVDAEPDAAATLIRRCARLPLALRIAAARAAARPALRLTALAAEVTTAFDGPDPMTSLGAVFSWSYTALTPAAARLFRLLGLHPGPDVTVAAASSLAAAPAAAPLAELAAAHLVAETSAGRYSFHDLLRGYAHQRAHEEESAPQLGAARQRLLDHYLHTGLRAALLYSPMRNPIIVGEPAPGTTPELLADRVDALGWFTAEHHVLLAAVRDAEADTHTWQLAWTLTDYLDRNGHWTEQLAVQALALAATRRLRDRDAQSRTHNAIAHAHMRLGRFEQARDEYAHALDLCRDLDDLGGQARAHNNLTTAYEALGRPRDGLQHALLALDLHRTAGNHAEEANAHNGVGYIYAQLGDDGEALRHCETALALVRAHGYPLAEAATLDSLGYIHRRQGALDRAVGCYRDAAELLRSLNDRYHEAEVLNNLAETCRDAGDPDGARAAWREALAIFEELSMSQADGVRAQLAALR